MELTSSDYAAITRYIHRICGIELGPGKEYLIHQRLTTIAQTQGCATFGEFARIIGAVPDSQLRDQIIAAVTTNETSFFRDAQPFEFFKSDVMPWLCALARDRKNRLPARRGPKVTILCAGASTGQEPYSLSIIMHEYLRFNAAEGVGVDDVSIVAADISSRVLARAIAGEFSELDVGRGLTELQRSVYFTRNNGHYEINDDIKRIVDFRRVNFIEPFGHLGGFDVVFCRNMLIYFDDETRRRIVDQFADMLIPGGYLILGSTENLYTLNSRFESSQKNGCLHYRRK